MTSTFNVLMLGRLLAAALRGDNKKITDWLNTLDQKQIYDLHKATMLLENILRNYL